MGSPQYVLLDGDQVGRRIEDLLLRNALPRLYFFAQDLNDAVVSLSRVFRKAGGLVYVCGGDTVLGSVENVRSFLAAMHSVRNTLPLPFSAGVGSTVRDALLALKLAKARGPGTVVRVRQIRGDFRASHWEEPEGWREERPASRAAPRRRSRKTRRHRRPPPDRA